MNKREIRHKTYTEEIRRNAVESYINGIKSRGKLVKELKISPNTFDTWVHNYRKNNTFKDRRGRPKGKEEIDYKERYEILKNFQAFLKGLRQEKK